MHGRCYLNDQLLQNLFSILDLNHDGFLDVNEIGDCLEKFVNKKPDYLKNKEIWNILSLSPWIPFSVLTRQINKISGVPEQMISSLLQDINIEKTPNVTFWQFLRSSNYPGGEKIIEILGESGLIRQKKKQSSPKYLQNVIIKNREDQSRPSQLEKVASPMSYKSPFRHQEASIISEDPFLKHKSIEGNVEYFSPSKGKSIQFDQIGEPSASGDYIKTTFDQNYESLHPSYSGKVKNTEEVEKIRIYGNKNGGELKFGF